MRHLIPRHFEVTVVLAFVLAAATLPAPADAPASPQSKTAEDLSWLTGCWRFDRTAGYTEEYWMAPAGGAMLGISRTIRNGKMTEHEFVAIREVDGVLSYVAKPSGQAEAAFAAVTISPTEVVFENMAHDFPQRIIYRKTSGGLTARVEGTVDDQLKGSDFPYEACR